jgi:putative ABC transport system ATP-binding protein
MLLFDQISLYVHQQELLSHTSLHVHSGEKMVLRGSSGSGKSSLLKCAVGAISLRQGSVTIDNIQLSSSTVSDIRERIAYIGQEPSLGAERVQEAIDLPFTFKAHRDNQPTEKQLHTLLERLHLSADILKKPCSRISGGEKQRIAIIRALLLGKSIFLADEVTSALDPESKKSVMEELFRPEITLLSVSHDPEWIRACDRIVEIQEKQIREIPA